MLDIERVRADSPDSARYAVSPPRTDNHCCDHLGNRWYLPGQEATGGNQMTEQVGKHYVLLNANKRAGGLSTVRKGIDTRDGSSVAVKIIVGSSDELSRKVFERETRSLRSLSHPNIVGFRDAGVTDTGSYY